MKTIEIKLYSFDELTEQAKEIAIIKNADINIYDEWWDAIYDNAFNVHLDIIGFDIYHRDITVKFIYSAIDTAHAIMQNHGENCGTYKLSKQFLSDYDKLVEKHSDGINKNIVDEQNVYEFDKDADDLGAEFLSELEQEYLSILQSDYDYLTSDEAIAETLIANEFEFTENGSRY